MLYTYKKKNIISEHKQSQNDTGSPEVQIALLTSGISNLEKHFKNHKQDLHSRRGLIRLVSKRRKLLNYFKNRNINGYRSLVRKLGLRK